MRTDPRPTTGTPRHHQLKGNLAHGTHRGQTCEQWQIEVTGGGKPAVVHRTRYTDTGREIQRSRLIIQIRRDLINHVVVDLRGFEPLTPSMRTRCATGLRHRPLQRGKL